MLAQRDISLKCVVSITNGVFSIRRETSLVFPTEVGDFQSGSQREFTQFTAKTFSFVEFIQNWLETSVIVLMTAAWENRSFNQNSFLIENVTTFSQEAKSMYMLVDMASLQMELADLQANVAVRKKYGVCDPNSF